MPVMVLSSAKEPLMYCTALLLTERTWPLLPRLAVCELDFTEGDWPTGVEATSRVKLWVCDQAALTFSH